MHRSHIVPCAPYARCAAPLGGDSGDGGDDETGVASRPGRGPPEPVEPRPPPVHPTSLVRRTSWSRWTRDAGLEPYTERFAQVGLDVLLFDYRPFGPSSA